MKRTNHSAIAIIGAALLAASCTVTKQETPSLTGPSEFGTSITVEVSPDILPTDGGSQSRITITARDANGKPLPGVSLRTEIRVDGVAVDLGTLSARNVVTDSNGRATAIYTAPAIGGGVDTQTIVTIAATPVGTDFANAVMRTASIRLAPVGVIVPPVDLRASFTSSPAFPTDNQDVVFDASASTGSISSFQWSFGDGSTASGRVATHAFRSPGTYAVTLTVFDPLGRANETTRSVQVSAGSAPTAAATFSPQNPVPGTQVVFNGAGSRAAAGRTIVRYDWSFGDGATGSGVETTHTYVRAGQYTAVLMVTDDAGRTSTANVSVTVGGTGPTASFTVSPTDPQPCQAVFFNASASSAPSGRSIVSYEWDFGDGRTGTGVTVQKPGTPGCNGYALEGTYTVTLVVVDDQGFRGTTTRTVQVKFPTIE